MRNTRKRLMECLKALRSQMQVNWVLTKTNGSLQRQVEHDLICGAWTNEEGMLAAINRTVDGNYRVILYKNGKRACVMYVRDKEGQLYLYELLSLEFAPVVYFKYSELVLLGHRGIFRRLNSGSIEWNMDNSK